MSRTGPERLAGPPTVVPGLTGEQGVGDELLHLALGQIKAYEHNPRRAANSHYERIKASIRTAGIEQPLVVTRRPGEDQYTVFAGGNTRLRVLHELHEETGEARFAEVTCVYRPWTEETDVLLAHLKENDLRGALTFLDKALAVLQARRMIEAQRGGGRLSQAELAGLLRDRGYGVTQGVISLMGYAAERLLPLVPQALENGLGRSLVERTRRLEKAARVLWLEGPVDTETEFDVAFETLCRRFDGVEYDFAGLRRALEAEIAERAQLSLHAVHLRLEERLSGDRAEAIRDFEEQAGERPGPGSANASGPKPVNDQVPSAHLSESPATPVTDAVQAAPRPASPDERQDPGGRAPSPDGHRSSPETEDEGPPRVLGALPAEQSPGPTDLKSLRARAWTLASRLAQRNGFGDLVRALPGQGLGFLLTDVPDPALVEQLDEQALAQVSMIWWQLAAGCELTVAPIDLLLPALAEGSVLYRALEDQDAGLLFSSVWTLDPGHSGYRLWRCLDDKAWSDLLALMETYRALYRVAEAANQPLWP